VAESIHLLYENNTAPLGYAAYQYKGMAEKMDDQLRRDMDEQYRQTVIEPLGKMSVIAPEFQELMKKRGKKMLDYDRARSTVKKLVDKPSDDPGKLPKVILFKISRDSLKQNYSNTKTFMISSMTN
jgi:hypothetical protein